MPRFVVAYDISSDRQRQKVSNLLAAVLRRVQLSVFEGDAKRAEVEAVVRQALALIDPETDSLRVYRVCAACVRKIDVYGKTPKVEPQPVIIL